MTGNSPTSPGSLCAVVLILPCYPWDQGLSLTGTSQTCSPPPLPPRPTTPFPSPTVVDATSAIFFARTFLWRQHVCVCAPWTGWWSKAGAGHTVGHGPQDPDLNHGQRGLLGTRPTMQRGLLGTRPTMQRGLLGTRPTMQRGLLGTRPTMQRGLLGTRPTMQRVCLGPVPQCSVVCLEPVPQCSGPSVVHVIPSLTSKDTQHTGTSLRLQTPSDQSHFTDTQYTATSLILQTPNTQRPVFLYRHPATSLTLQTHGDQSSFTDTQRPVFLYRHPATSLTLQTPNTQRPVFLY